MSVRFFGLISKAILVLCSISGCVSANADTLEIQALRSSTPLKWQSINVSNGCKAMSHTASSMAGYLITWEGGCLDGYAHGQGIKRIWALGQPLSTLLGTYEVGRWTATAESYTVSKGVIIKGGPSPSQAIFNDIRVEPVNVPSWAKDIVSQQPISLLAWKNDVTRRLLVIKQMRDEDLFEKNYIDEKAEKSEMELLFEVESKNPDETSGYSTKN